MDLYEKKQLVNENSNYRLTFMNEDELRNEIKNWNREDLIDWLKWNDPNGIYDDKSSLSELGSIMTFEQGVEIIIDQVIQ